MAILDYKIDRYATRVIGDRTIYDHSIYDAIELQGVRNVNEVEVTVDNDNPDEFSVYLHYDAGVECVGDFTRYTDALQYALELSDELSLEIHDYARPK